MNLRFARVRPHVLVGLATAVVLLAIAVPAGREHRGDGIVISQVYGGAGRQRRVLDVHERLHRALQPDARDDQPHRLVGPVRERRPARTSARTDARSRARRSRPASTTSSRRRGSANGVGSAAGAGRRPARSPCAAGAARSRSSTARPRSTAAARARTRRLADRRPRRLRAATPANFFEGAGPRRRPRARTTAIFRGERRLHRHRQQRHRLHGGARRRRATRARPRARLRDDAEPLDQRRLAERGQRGHDDVHLHGQPLGAGRRRRRHVRHRDRATARATAPTTTTRRSR